MNLKRFVIALLAAVAVSVMAWPSTAVGGPQQQLDGWFSGGAMYRESTGPSGDSRAVISLALSCDLSENPQHLQVTWGRGNRFRLDELSENECFVFGDPAGSWTRGAGTGRYNGVPGATVGFILIDFDNPGEDDLVVVVIRDAGGTILLAATSVPDGGHIQFHQE